MVCIKVPASSANLGPGFDTLGMALSLFNYIEMVETGSADELLIEVEGEGASSIARDQSNVTWLAAREVFQIAGRYPAGLLLQLKNKIPSARGLGSSAAARVGGLLAANYLIGEPLNREQLLQLAVRLEGHPDNVAPALLGGLVVACQSDQELVYRQLTVPERLTVILAIPGFELSTHDAVQALPSKIPLEDAVFNIGQACLFITAILTQDWSLIGQAMGDRIHQSYRQRLVPGLSAVMEAARAAGALGAALSGAGPTVLALALDDQDQTNANNAKPEGVKTVNRSQQIGKTMQAAFWQHGVDSIIRILKPWSQGAELIACSNIKFESIK